MPRFIAHVRTAQGNVDSLDCDTAEIDGNGFLWLMQGPKGQQPHACFAPGAWLSYTLQAPPKDEPEPGTSIVVTLDSSDLFRQIRREFGDPTL